VSVRTETSMPVRKVAASGIAAAVVSIGVWALGKFAQIDIPPEVAASIVTVVSFLAGYLVPPAVGDTPVNTK
jgi:hypothetical protein